MARYTPSLEEFRQSAQRGNLVPVYREILADGDTPVSAYAKLGRGEHTFLLESVIGGEKWAAYSFIGVGVHAVFTARDGRYKIDRSGKLEEGAAADPTVPLDALLKTYRPVVPPGLPRFFGGAVGYFSYDVVRAFERLPSRVPDELKLPECYFVITDTLVIFDNLRQTVKVVANALVDGDADRAYADACRRIDAIVETLEKPAPKLRALDPMPQEATSLPSSNLTREQFCAQVEKAKEYILSGDIFQVVLSQRFSTEAKVDPFDVYRALRVVNPSPYMFHLNFPVAKVTGASPEVFVRVENGRVMVRPIAGTRPRGKGADEDAALERELLASEKERAEHVMLIDLGRNDVGRVAETGSVRVDEQMVVERYSHVMHLVSHVSGALSPTSRALDVLRACFPAGTLTGAPKIRAMEIIEELESSRRGIYGGAVGYVSFTGNLDLAIAIRTLVSTGDRVYVQAGAGVVADSSPDGEFDETVQKARAVLRALDIARGEKQ